MEDYDKGYVQGFKDVLDVLRTHDVYSATVKIAQMGEDLTARMFEKYND